MQEKVSSGEISSEKVDGKDNLADALTKYFGREDLERHSRLSGQHVSQGKHVLIVKQARIWRQIEVNVNPRTS